MCLKLHHVRYTTRNSENVFCCFLVMKLVPTVVLETHINMSPILINLPLKIDCFETHFLEGAV